jgi:hypothetical protein
MSSTLAGPNGAVDGVPAEVASDLEEADTLSGAANCLISTEIVQVIKPKRKSLPKYRGGDREPRTILALLPP